MIVIVYIGVSLDTYIGYAHEGTALPAFIVQIMDAKSLALHLLMLLIAWEEGDPCPDMRQEEHLDCTQQPDLKAVLLLPRTQRKCVCIRERKQRGSQENVCPAY